MSSRQGVLEAWDGAVWIGVPPKESVPIPAVGLTVEGVRTFDAEGVEAWTPWGDVQGVRMDIREQPRWRPGWLLWTGRALLAAIEAWWPSEADSICIRWDLLDGSVVHESQAHNGGGYPPDEVRVAHSLASLLVEFAELRPVLRDPERLLELVDAAARPTVATGQADTFSRLLAQVRAELAA